jgi:hypothetical protein
MLGRAPARRRAVAAPAIEPGAISALVADVRRRVEGGEIASCVVVVAPAEIDRAVPLLERALAEGPDVDLELVGGTRAEDVAGPGDLVL